MMSKPTLALPYAEDRYILDTDACNVHVGCVLLQEQPKRTNNLDEL